MTYQEHYNQNLFFVIPASKARRESVFQARQTADSGQVYPPLAAPKATRAGMTDINRERALLTYVLIKGIRVGRAAARPFRRE